MLRFSAERARWVADENLASAAAGRSICRMADTSCAFPYRDARELVMDIMRHGAHVEVIEPDDLRQQVVEQLRRAAERYRD